MKQERSQTGRTGTTSVQKLEPSVLGDTREDNDAYGTRSACALASAVRKEASKSFIKIMEKHAGERRDKFISFVPKNLSRKGNYVSEVGGPPRGAAKKRSESAGKKNANG